MEAQSRVNRGIVGNRISRLVKVFEQIDSTDPGAPRWVAAAQGIAAIKEAMEAR